jgi:PTS system galactitol-specific IIA component
MNGLAALVRPEFVSIAPHPVDAESIIRELGALLVTSGTARPTLPSAAVERERAYPTGLLLSPEGPNAALPHADREHVITSAAAVAVLREPVQFHRMDDPAQSVPVRLVILLALAEPDGQLAALREAGALLQDAVRVARLVAAKTPAEVLAVLGEAAS